MAHLVYSDFQPYSPHHQQLVHIAERILNMHVVRFQLWPRYYQELLLCTNLNVYEERVKLAGFCVLNRIPFQGIAFCIRVLNYFENFKHTTIRNIRKFIALERYLTRVDVISTYNSYDLETGLIMSLDRHYVYSQVPNNDGIPAAACGNAIAALYRLGFISGPTHWYH